jgi:hypothetical protein
LIAHIRNCAAAPPRMEKPMKRILAVAAASLALLGAQAVLAQQGPGAAMPEQNRFSPEDMKAMTDAKIAAVKTGLELTAEQEKNWPAVEQAIRAMAEAQQAQRDKMRDAAKTEDGIAKLRARAEAMELRAAGLRKLADAAEPLYRTLSDDQKRRLHFLVQMVMPHRGDHRHGGWRQGW